MFLTIIHMSKIYNELYEKISPGSGNVDKSHMLVNVATFPDSLLHALGAYSRVPKLLEKIPRDIKGIVISGMGGSFIGGLFLQDVLYDTSNLPIFLVRDPILPQFVDSSYLLIAVSYSGNTEETLRVFGEALQRKIPIISVTSGGLLQKYSEKNSVPVVSLPQGFQPRAAFPYMAAALLSITETITGDVGLLKQLSECAENMKATRDEALMKTIEDAKDFFSNIEKGLTPLIYSYRPYISVGYRFKTQLNENAKIHAFYLDLPEANHNEIMGWRQEASDKFFATIIRGSQEQYYMTARIEFLIKHLEASNIPTINFLPEPRYSGKKICELLDLVFRLDLISVATALKLKTDPTPVDTITKLKKHLEKHIDVEKELFPQDRP